MSAADFDQRRDGGGLSISLRLRTLNVGLEFATEFAHGILHRPRSPVRQTANCSAWYDRHVVGNLEQQIHSSPTTFARSDPIHNLQRPRRTVAARRALPARLMREILTTVVQEVDHRR